METTTPSPLRRRLGAALLLLGLPLAGTALAMPGGDGCGAPGGRYAMHGQQRGDGPMAGFDGPGMHAGGGRLPHLLRGLKLDEAQQDKVFELIHAQAPAEHEQRKAIRKARQELQQLAAADSFDAARARILADAQGKAVAAMALAHAELEARVRALLTPEQRSELDRQRERGAGDGRGPRGR